MADPISATFAAIGSAIASATAATASGLIALGVGAGAAKAIASFVIPTLINAALSIGAAALLAPDVNREGSPTDWRPDPNAGIPVVLGRAAFAGRLIHMDEHGPDNRYVTAVNLLSAGPIDALESFRADRVPVSFSGTGATSPAEFADRMWLSTALGSRTQTTALSIGSLPHGEPSFAGWDANSILPGLAHTLWTLYHDSKSYPGGMPVPQHIVRGAKIYDPRKDSTYPGGAGAHRLDDPETWEFSKNPGLHAIGWALAHTVIDPNTGKVFRLGIGASPSGLNWPAFVELANVCDANGWDVSAVPTSRDNPHQVLKAILQAGGARYDSLAGKISCVARTPRTSVVTVSAADTAGPFEIEVNADRLTRRNTITPRCVQEDHNWQMTPQDVVSVTEYVTADGGALAQPLDFPYVAVAPGSANVKQPRQLAAYAMLDSRESLVGTAPFLPHMAQLQPGDVFTVDDPGLLLAGVELLVVKRDIDAPNNIVQITFISESAGKHDFALGRTNTPPTPPGLTAPDIRAVPAPSAAIFSATPGAGRQPSITLTASNIDAAHRGYLVELRRTTDLAGDPISYPDNDTGWEVYGEYDIATEQVIITGLEPATGYQIAIRYVSEYRILGERRILTTITTGAMVASDSAAVGDLIDSEEFVAEGILRLSKALAELRNWLDDEVYLEGQPVTAKVIEEREERETESAAVLDAAEAGDAAVAARVRRLSAPSENLIADTWNRAGGSQDWRDQTGAPAQIVPKTGFAALRAYHTATGAGQGLQLVHLPRKRVEAGEVYEVSARLTVSGTASAPKLKLAIYATQDGATPSATLAVELDSGVRDGSASVTIPAGGGWARFEAESISTGAGAGAFELEGSLWRLADTGQSAISAAPSKEDPSLAFIKQVQAVTSTIAVQSDRLRVANTHALAEIRNIVVAQLGDQSALVSQVETLEASVGTLSATLTTLQETVAGVVEEAVLIERLQVGTVLNRIRDPLFDRGSEDFITDSAPPVLVKEGGTRHLRIERTAGAAGDSGFIEHMPAIRVYEGQSLEWSPRARLGGVASSASLRLRFTDLDGNAVSTLTGAAITGAGWQTSPAFLTAPEDGYVYPRIVAVASGAGALTLDMDEPQLLGALAGQTVRSNFERARSPVAAELLDSRIASAREVARQERLQLNAGNAQARITEETSVRQTETSALALKDTQLEASIESVSDDLATNYATAAAISATYLTQAETDSSIAAFNLGLNATFSSLALDVDGIETDLATNYLTTAQANLAFTTLAEVDAAISAFNLGLNATFSSLALDVAGIETDLATNYLTTAQANLAFTTLAEVDAAISAFDLSLNSTFGTLSSSVDLNAAAITDLEGAVAGFSIVVAADGSTPAIVELTSGVGGSAVALKADRIYLGDVQIFTEDGASILLADNVVASNVAADTITAREIVSASLGVRKKVEGSDHLIIPYGTYATGADAHAAYDSIDFKSPNQVANPGDEIELEWQCYIEATAWIFTHHYFQVRIYREVNNSAVATGAGVVELQQEYISHYGVSGNASDARMPVPYLSQIRSTDTVPAGVSAGSDVRYHVQVLPVNMNGPFSAFEGWNDDYGQRSLIAQRYRFSALLFSDAIGT